MSLITSRDAIEKRYSPNGSDTSQEIRHFDRMLLRREEEIESIFNFCYRDTVPIGVVLENELFEVQEGTFVVDFLSDLDHRSPGVLGG